MPDTEVEILSGDSKKTNTITEAIVLAGGLGTRLRPVVSDLPKCMAPVAGRPFIGYLLDYYIHQGIREFIFAVGYKAGPIQEFLAKEYSHIRIRYSIESSPLGTGGAIKKAAESASGNTVLVLNGDTFFGGSLQALSAFHTEKKASCSIFLKKMYEFDRYGSVELNPDLSVKAFQEKKYYSSGLINAGVYALELNPFLKANLPEAFSFEKEFLENPNQRSKLFGLPDPAYFIDIGIPEDYARAQWELMQNI